MSILIKGMDMPDLGENAERLWVPCWIEVDKDGKAIFCTGTHFDPNTIRSYPIEEVPTPHGDLIDRSKIHYCHYDLPNYNGSFYAAEDDWINEMTPVIKAEGKT